MQGWPVYGMDVVYSLKSAARSSGDWMPGQVSGPGAADSDARAAPLVR